MRLTSIPKLLLLLLLLTFSNAATLADLQGTKGLAENDLKAMVDKLDTIGFRAVGKNEHLETHYYNKFKIKNLELLNFYTVADLESLRELLIANPDFAAYAPFNLLAFKMPQSEKESDTTWYGHLNVDTMLEIIGEKDPALQEKFKAMMAKLDTLVTTEMKPTEAKPLTFDKALPKQPLLKMVKKFGEVDDIEEFVEEFIVEHDGLFVKNKFIIAGFLDVKFEYDDLELEFDAYDAFWVSSLCHFEFSNAIFNHGEPQAGLFAPCSVYFYIPKDSGELHVGYASVDNWIASTGIKDEKKVAYMREISASVVRVFEELGFEHTGEKEASTTEEKVKKTPATKAESEKETESGSVLIEFYGTKGQPEAELKSMVDKLGTIGYSASGKNEHLETHYYNKFKVKNLDLLNFYTIFDIQSLRPLLMKNPDFGAYAPFNLLAYKMPADHKDGDTTWYGHLNTNTMLDIIGEKDQTTRDEFKAMVNKVDEHVKAEMKPTERKVLTYTQKLPQEPLLKMVKDIGDVDDIEEFVEEFIVEHDGLFVKNKFIIAGFLDIKFEYDDLDLEFDAYDAYWVSSLCHFEFSHTVFNHGSPHAGAFAPCSVYFYIPKDSGKLHVGYASVDNWIATTGITDPEKVQYMQEISASVIRIFKELGFKLESSSVSEKKAPQKTELVKEAVKVENIVQRNDKPKETALKDMTSKLKEIAEQKSKVQESKQASSETKVTETTTAVSQTSQPEVKTTTSSKTKKEGVVSQESKRAKVIESTPKESGNGNDKAIRIDIPKVPEVPKPVRIYIESTNHNGAAYNPNDRSIKFSKRVPPNYIPSSQRYAQGGEGSSLSHSDVMVGDVDKGRIAAYLRDELLTVEEAKKKLINAGFEIVSISALDKKKKLTSIVFTSNDLKSMIKKENQGHLATLRLLVNKKDKQISITNPLYLSKAFLGDDFNKESAVKILTALTTEFKGVKNSLDKLKFQLLPKYQFMDGLPYFKDYIVIARGDNLKSKLEKNKRIEYAFDLKNGATLVGVTLSKRTRKFPKKIGTKNAAMLPYPLLIENGEAKILDPKYYLALMYPQLTMEEFMTIATIPDAIVNDCTKVFR
jgi:hypothetical protein